MVYTLPLKKSTIHVGKYSPVPWSVAQPFIKSDTSIFFLSFCSRWVQLIIHRPDSLRSVFASSKKQHGHDERIGWEPGTFCLQEKVKPCKVFPWVLLRGKLNKLTFEWNFGFGVAKGEVGNQKHHLSGFSSSVETSLLHDVRRSLADV